METTAKKEYTIDATGKRLGRVATEVATIILGKNSPTFAKNQTADVIVKISNTSKLDISPKRGEHEFQNYSGFPGGRKVESLDHLAKRRGYSEIMRRVISGMIPKNKLHAPRMKNLVISE